VGALVRKERLNLDAEAQTLEDVEMDTDSSQNFDLSRIPFAEAVCLAVVLAWVLL